jgi:hypothetical protein
MISGLENMFIQEGGKQQNQRNQSYGGKRRRSRGKGTRRRGKGRGKRTRRH